MKTEVSTQLCKKTEISACSTITNSAKLSGPLNPPEEVKLLIISNLPGEIQPYTIKLIKLFGKPKLNKSAKEETNFNTIHSSYQKMNKEQPFFPKKVNLFGKVTILPNWAQTSLHPLNNNNLNNNNHNNNRVSLTNPLDISRVLPLDINRVLLWALIRDLLVAFSRALLVDFSRALLVDFNRVLLVDFRKDHLVAFNRALLQDFNSNNNSLINLLLVLVRVCLLRTLWGDLGRILKSSLVESKEHNSSNNKVDRISLDNLLI